MNEQAERLERVSSPELDAILGQAFPVLDDGHVRVIDYMGGEESIVQAARVSYGKGTKKVSEDKNLIKYLLRHRHTTPFEMPTIMFHVRVPMDCWRQWIRHRTASVNEYSTRYSEAIDDNQLTPPSEWRSQAKDNKQGSGAFLDIDAGTILSDAEGDLHKLATSVYQSRLDAGVAKEQARKDLLLSTYTEAYWKMDLHNLIHFLMLRMDSHAQLEIRSYADAIGNEIVSKWVPTVWEAFQDVMAGTMLTGNEIDIVKSILQHTDEWKVVGKKQGWLKEDGELTKRSRVRDEIEFKLNKMGVLPPWCY